jgi:hypothetical protein
MAFYMLAVSMKCRIINHLRQQ